MRAGIAHLERDIRGVSSEEEKKILEGLRDSDNFKPNPAGDEKGFFEKMHQFFK